jgi:amino acid permease
MTMPYLIGMAGYLGGLLICLVVTGAAVGGSTMLLRIKLRHPSCGSFGDLGMAVLGRPGQVWGNVIQIGSFCMILPCALQF